jgi:hypothetical protein
MSDEAKPEAPARIWANDTWIATLNDEYTTAYKESGGVLQTAYIRADLADGLAEALTALVSAKALAGVREIVAGWNGEGKPDGPYARHADRLGATLPKTNCGAVYALDEAMTAARNALAAFGAAGKEGKKS